MDKIQRSHPSKNKSNDHIVSYFDVHETKDDYYLYFIHVESLNVKSFPLIERGLVGLWRQTDYCRIICWMFVWELKSLFILDKYPFVIKSSPIQFPFLFDSFQSFLWG